MSAITRIRSVGSSSDHLHHPLGPVVRQVCVALVGDHARRHAPQVLDQSQAEHDRHRPQLSELQWGDGLVGSDEAVEADGVHSPIDVSNQVQSDAVGPRVSRRRAVPQPRQLPAVRLRQMPPGRPDLLLDQIKIVQQPLAAGAIRRFAATAAVTSSYVCTRTVSLSSSRGKSRSGPRLRST